MHGVDRIGRIDHDATLRFALRDLEEALTKPFMEGTVFPLEAGFAPATSLGPGQSFRHRQVQDQGQVGSEITGDEAMQRLQRRTRHAPGRALIGEGRIGEAIGDHPVAPRQRRPDGGGEMVAPRRRYQQRFADRVPALRLALDQQFADCLGAGSAAGLARCQRRDPGAVQRLDEKAKLSGLAGALAALEGDEAAAAQCLAPQIRYPAVSAIRPSGPSGATASVVCNGTSTASLPGATMTSLPMVWPFATGAFTVPS